MAGEVVASGLGFVLQAFRGRVIGSGVRCDGRAADDGVVLIGDALAERLNLGGLLVDDTALDVEDVVEAVGICLDGVGRHVEGAGVGPRANPPEGGHLVRSDDGHGGEGAVGWVRHGSKGRLLL